MTAVFKDVRPGTRLRVLPSAAGCLVPGEVLAVREMSYGLYVPCEAGRHFLIPTAEGVLRDFEMEIVYVDISKAVAPPFPTAEAITLRKDACDATG